MWFNSSRSFENFFSFSRDNKDIKLKQNYEIRITRSRNTGTGRTRNDPAFPAAGKAYGEALQAAGIFIGGAGLESSETATTVSIRGGKRQVHDGPYPETKEFLAGFAIIDVPNLDAALEWAARHPAAAFASVEIRPLLGSYFAVGTPKAS